MIKCSQSYDKLGTELDLQPSLVLKLINVIKSDMCSIKYLVSPSLNKGTFCFILVENVHIVFVLVIR